MLWRLTGLGLAALVIVLAGFSLIETNRGDAVNASAQMIMPDTSINGFMRAIDPWDWQFPHDYGAHPRFQTEWWYYTGNLADETGRRFGYQFTIFRRAITPVNYESTSEWRTDQVYMAHLTLTDVADGAFYQEQRFSREGVGLAGAVVRPRFRVWLENWQVVAQDDSAIQTTITADMDHIAIHLNLEQIKPPALQGDNGLSPKSDEPGKASYYYSFSRLLTGGTITLDGAVFDVSGTTWMDHEFGTDALGDDALGWDWFGLHLDDGRDLMLGQIRLNSGGNDLAFGGLLVDSDGHTRHLESGDFSITAQNHWTSPHTSAVYPAGWNVTVDPGDSPPVNLVLRPLISDQELYGSGVAYWEGAVQITGDVNGYGYAELTGYASAMAGRF
jgi:predicted secreted hydrolase